MFKIRAFLADRLEHISMLLEDYAITERLASWIARLSWKIAPRYSSRPNAITTAFIEQYKANVYHLVNQKQSKLRGARIRSLDDLDDA